MLTPILELTNQEHEWAALDHDSQDGFVAVADITVTWGTNEAQTQPEPSVMRFSVIDRTGYTSAHPERFVGQRVRLRLRRDGREPVTVFTGIIQNGLTTKRVTYRGQPAWRLDLTATALLVLWKRLRANGPYADTRHHWRVSSSTARDVMNSRAREIDAPWWLSGDLVGRFAPPSLDEHPSQFTLMHEIGEDGTLPLWYENARRNVIEPVRLAGHEYVKALDIDARMVLIAHVTDSTTGDVVHATAVGADMVESSGEWDMLPPYTQLVYRMRNCVTRDDGGLDFEETERTVPAWDLPEPMPKSQRSLVIETRLIAASRSRDYQPVPDGFARQAARYLYFLATRYIPAAITFDASRCEDIDRYMCYPAKMVLFQRLAPTPFDSYGPYAPIGGTLRISVRHGTPSIRHEVNLFPLISANSQPTVRWEQIPEDYTTSFERMDIPIYELQKTEQFLPYKAAA